MTYQVTFQKGETEMINTRLIKAKIVENGLTQAELAKQMGMTPKTFSVKMNSGKFGLDEADKMISLLHIEKPELYFFAKEVTC